MSFKKTWEVMLLFLFIAGMCVTGCVRVHVSLPSSYGLNDLPPPVPGPVTHQLTVWRHSAASISEGEADAILQYASTIAQTNDQCELTLIRDTTNNIPTFDGLNGGVVSTDFDLVSATALPGIKVMKDVQWCDVPGPFAGCAELPGDSFVVERLSGSSHTEMEGVLWLHEFGHTKNNYHRSDLTAVMNPGINTNHDRINSLECRRYKN